MDIHTLSQRLAAELIGVTARAVRDWEAEGEEVPRNEDGTYDGPSFVQWYYSRGALDANRERARKDKEHADKLALENAERRGELLDADVALDEYGKLVTACRSRLIQIPDALGQFCDARYAPIITAEARRRIYEALNELAAEFGSGPVGAADSNGQRMGGH